MKFDYYLTENQLKKLKEVIPENLKDGFKIHKCKGYFNFTIDTFGSIELTILRKKFLEYFRIWMF